jgi:hypothetical protein
VERIPRLIDTLDSAWFALLTAGFGRRGRIAIGVVLSLLIGALASADATARHILLAAFMSYCIAEILRVVLKQVRVLFAREAWQRASQG